MRPHFRRISRRVKRKIPHRSARRLHRALAAAIAAGLAACGGSPTEPAPDLSAAKGQFSGAQAWAELEELADDPRPLGSDGAEAARDHITARLSAIGIPVETITTTAESKGYGPLALTHLVAK